MEDVVGAQPAFSNHRDTGAEDVRQRAFVVDQHRGRAILLSELDLQASIAAPHIVPIEQNAGALGGLVLTTDALVVDDDKGEQA